jgi:YVTN family beta-propeller protein
MQRATAYIKELFRRHVTWQVSLIVLIVLVATILFGPTGSLFANTPVNRPGPIPSNFADNTTGNAAAADATGTQPSGQTKPDPGRQGTRLINNWVVTPAGGQTNLWDLPLNSTLSPDGRHLLVVNSGAGIQSLQVVDTSNSAVIQTLHYVAPASVFVGVAYSPDGHHAYASGGGSDVVHTYSVASNASLVPAGDIRIGTGNQNPFPTGLSVSSDGMSVYVANNLSNTVSIINTAAMTVTRSIGVGSYPFTALVSEDNHRLYVSNWGDATVSAIDLPSGNVVATIEVGSHPSAMAFGPAGILFVADSNSDAISVVNTSTNHEMRRISVTPYHNAPPSTSPQGLAVSQDKRYLYVTNAGNNDVAVIQLNGIGGPETVLGRIPTAWYPTSVVIKNEDDKANGGSGQDRGVLYVTNAKGLGAGPNDHGYYPNPTRPTVPFQDAVDGYADHYCQCTFDQFTGSMITGTLSTINVPSNGQLRQYTAQVERNNHEGDTSILERDPGNPIPLPGGSSPIQHVIYIIKENRTYDQVFGDEPLGDGDPSLTLFPQANTPNLHALAERFGILDNFYADAEVSADGHNWAMSSNASDYNEKMWPQDYSPGAGRNRGYDFEGASGINLSPGGYLWDAAHQANISYRNYGEFIQFDANYPYTAGHFIPESERHTCTGPVATSYVGLVITPGLVLCFQPMDINPDTTPNLVGHYDQRFRTYDLRFHEADRIEEWQEEFNDFVTHNNLPRFEILRLPNDHTSGLRAGFPSPQNYVSENDYAVGQVVDIVSHSSYWASTAIFVTEDDAQNGPDHVDAHRTTSLAISPYTSRPQPRVDHTLYDTAAMVRTIELILGLQPLSQYDAAADPMWRTFSAQADTTPYDVIPEDWSFANFTAPGALGTAESANMDFSVEDRAPMDELNRVLWEGIKGPSVPYPQTPGNHSTSSNRDADDK